MLFIQTNRAHSFCSEKEEDAGPANHWKAPVEMRAILEKLLDRSMEG